MSLGCSLSSDLLEEFPVSIYGRFMSVTEPGEFTASYVPDQINGWNIQMERDAQTETVAQQSKQKLVNPYTDELRYCGGLERVFALSSNEEFLIDRVEFYVYDSILVGSTQMDADDHLYQDTETINLIKNSALSNTKIYAQAGFHNGMIGQWQPNWFNPKLEINGNPFLSTGEAGLGGNNSIADQSIGVPLPHCETFHYRMTSEPIKSVKIYAKCAQYIGDNDTPPTGKLQRYPVLALVFFRLKRN